MDLTDQVGVCRTDLGTKRNFLERNADRLQNDIDNLTEQESGLISSNPADEAIKLKECEYVWMGCAAAWQPDSSLVAARLHAVRSFRQINF